MSRKDELDVVIRKITDTEDLKSLSKILEIDILPADKEERQELLNEEIRHYYGHTFANFFRDKYEPDYPEIVRATAEKLKISVRDHHTLLDLEEKILAEVIDLAKASIIKEKGQAAWDAIERGVEEQLKKDLKEGKIHPSATAKLTGLAPGSLMAALVAGRLAGFALYIVANQAFFAIARSLGLRIGVGIAGPIIGESLAFLLGPAGWLIGGIWLAFDLGNTNWKKIIPAVVYIAILRRKFQYDSGGLVVP